MIRIGKAEGTRSKLRLCITSDAEIYSIPIKGFANRTNQEIAQILLEEEEIDCEVVDNFTFTATIIPNRWQAGRESGSIVFTDANDPFEYRMTQRNLFTLLKAVADGSIEARDNGLYGLYTFDATGAILTIKVFEE